MSSKTPTRNEKQNPAYHRTGFSARQPAGGPRGLHFLLLALGYPEEDARAPDTREDFCPDFLSFQKIDTTLSDDVLSFGTISDFDIKKEAWAAVRQTLPGIDIHYLSVTSSLGRIVTNDTAHRFFDISVHYSREENPACDDERFFSSLSPIQFIRFHGYSSKDEFIKDNGQDAWETLQKSLPTRKP